MSCGVFGRTSSCDFMDIHPSIVCWNVRGLNSPAKRKAVKEFLDTTKASLVCLQETKMDVIDSFVVMQCMGPLFDGFAYLPALETRGGILLAWNSLVLDVQNLQMDLNSLTGMVCPRVGVVWWITVVYGPQGDARKNYLSRRISAEKDTLPRTVDGAW